MFPKSFRLFILASLVVTFNGAVELSAQSAGQDAPVEQAPGEETENSPSLREPVLGSLFDGLLGVRNRVGFVFTLSEFYTPDILVGGATRRGSSFTSANASLFANVQRSRSNFHLDYSIGYRRDNRGLNLTGGTHTGSLSWNRNIGRRWSLGIADRGTVAANDYASTGRVSLYQTSQSYIDPQEIFLERQKVTRNEAIATTGYQISKRGMVSFDASHHYMQYQRSTFGTTQVAQVGVRGSYQVTKWFFLEGNYSVMFTNTGRTDNGSSVQRIRPLSLRFRRGGVEFFLAGGAQFAKNVSQKSQWAADADAVMSVGSNPKFSLRYNHGFTSFLGAGTAFESDNAFATLSYKLLGSISMTGSSRYTRSSRTTDWTFQSLGAGGGVQVAIVPDLVMATDYSYVMQMSNNVSFNAPQLHRYVVTASIHYRLPSLRVR